MRYKIDWSISLIDNVYNILCKYFIVDVTIAKMNGTLEIDNVIGAMSINDVLISTTIHEKPFPGGIINFGIKEKVSTLWVYMDIDINLFLYLYQGGKVPYEKDKYFMFDKREKITTNIYNLLCQEFKTEIAIAKMQNKFHIEKDHIIINDTIISITYIYPFNKWYTIDFLINGKTKTMEVENGINVERFRRLLKDEKDLLSNC